MNRGHLKRETEKTTKDAYLPRKRRQVNPIITENEQTGSERQIRQGGNGHTLGTA